MTVAIADLNLWGKQDGLPERYPLLCHLLDTAASAGVLWDRWLRPGLRDQLTVALAPGDPTLARRRMMAVAALHDIGKANPVFQGQKSASNDKPWAAEHRAQLAWGQPVVVDGVKCPVVSAGGHRKVMLGGIRLAGHVRAM